ncbi:MAG: cobalamin-binding protein [Spirochaetaceae bacterium]|jgi:iron complex transport system substrate-binding protein|nr:cobalamin-binding protein [Spirochaetaceae bacterium]
MKTIPIIMAAFLSAALLVSCTEKRGGQNSAAAAGPAAEETGSREVRYPLTITDVLGREVTVEARPARLVSLSPAITEVLFAIDAGDQIVGVTEYCDYPPEAKTRTTVGGFSGVTVNVERVAGLKPDLVLVSGDMHQRIMELLARLGITSFATEPRTFEDVYRTIDELGRITGNGEGAGRVLGEMRAKVERAGSLRGDRPRPAVFWELSPDPLLSAGRDTWVNDAITLAGGTNIFGDIAGQYPQVGLEQILLKQPEWILTAAMVSIGADPANYASRPGWSQIPAVRRGNIGAIDADSVYRFGPRLADATLAIAETLFGDGGQ